MLNHAIKITRHLNIRYRLLSCLGLVLIQAACASYQYIPPATDTGRQCVATCELGQQSCMANAQQTAASASHSCEMNRAYALDRCLDHASSQADRQSCNNSASANYCGRSVSPYECEPQYRRCFTACGGQAIEK